MNCIGGWEIESNMNETSYTVRYRDPETGEIKEEKVNADNSYCSSEGVSFTKDKRTVAYFKDVVRFRAND